MISIGTSRLLHPLVAPVQLEIESPVERLAVKLAHSAVVLVEMNCEKPEELVTVLQFAGE
jgi:hypothetical protein